MGLSIHFDKYAYIYASSQIVENYAPAKWVIIFNLQKSTVCASTLFYILRALHNSYIKTKQGITTVFLPSFY